jgi:hypothetical protein
MVSTSSIPRIQIEQSPALGTRLISTRCQGLFICAGRQRSDGPFGGSSENEKMTQSDQLATLMTFLLLGYLALTLAGAFAFTFIW